MRTLFLLPTMLAGVTALASTPSVQLAPTTVTVPAGESATSVAIRNTSANPIGFRASALRWTNVGEQEMHLEATDDLIVFPVTLVIPPREARRIRIGARSKSGSVERSYRLILEEVSIQPSSASSAGLAMRMRFSLPVFFQPKDRRASVELAAPEILGARVHVAVRNVGGLHVTPREVTVTGRETTGDAIWSRTLPAWYLLAGESRTYARDLTPDECARTALVTADIRFLEGNGLTLHKEQRVGPRACDRQ